MSVQDLQLFIPRDVITDGIIRTAYIDNSLQYRYRLQRIRDDKGPTVSFLMLNPSTADALADDPTIRRCMNFAWAWGYGVLEVLNLFAYRTAHPSELDSVADPVGPENDDMLIDCMAQNKDWVLAWGATPLANKRGQVIISMLREWSCKIQHMGFTKHGHPKHPLYLRADTEREDF